VQLYGIAHAAVQIRTRLASGRWLDAPIRERPKARDSEGLQECDKLEGSAHPAYLASGHDLRGTDELALFESVLTKVQHHR
jgi:hypothetical protein